MSDQEKDEVIDAFVGNAGVSTWQTGLAAAVNDTYSFANSSYFCAVLAGYYRDYAWRYIRVACQWLDGYVPSLHQGGVSGIISTRIASKLISGLGRQIVGEKLVYRLVSQQDQEGMEALKDISNWAKKNNAYRAVKNAISFSLGLGTSLIKINKKMDGTPWWEAVRFDNAFFLTSFTGEVKEASFLIRGYSDTRDAKNTVQYFLVEHRFWQYYEPKIRINADGTSTVVHKKGDRDAMVEFAVHRAPANSLHNTMAASLSRRSIKWDEIPKEIKKMIREDYGAIRIGEPQLLGMTNLGVEVLCNGEGDISIPTGTNFGESMIIGIQDDLITYEVATSYLLRDMYNGKGTVYLPKSMSIGDVAGLMPGVYSTGENNNGVIQSPAPANPLSAPANSPLSGLSDKYEVMKGVNPEDQQAIVQQFEVRAAEWQVIKENSLKNIAVKWGMSPKILSSFLAQGAAQMTATQIDSEDDISIAFINLERSYFKEPINRLLETTLNMMGKPANVEIDFASPSLINKDRIINRASQLLEAGLIDTDDAIRMIYPDLDEEALQNKIAKAQAARQAMMMEQLNMMNSVGEFGPEGEEGLGGPNLNGTTETSQS